MKYTPPVLRRADEIVPGDVIRLSRTKRMNVVAQPESEKGRELHDGIVVLYLQENGSSVITPFELSGSAEAERQPDGSWWL